MTFQTLWKNGLGPFLAILLLLAGAGSARGGHIVVGMAQSAACVGCHGADAFNGKIYSPSLAGQRSEYVVIQLKAFRKETRFDPVMSRIAGDMTDDEIDNLAAYFASLQPLTRTTKPNKRLVAEGRKEYKACSGCHQSIGEGRGEIARLAGQQQGYLLRQMKAFQEGKRPHPEAGGISKLSERQMRALAEYIAYLK